MLIERSMSPEWLSNTYLVTADGAGEAVLIDAGGPVAPLLEAVKSRGHQLTHVLLTHHHHDHVAELDQVLEAFGDVQVLAHSDERVLGVTDTIEPGAVLSIAGLSVEALPTPGHTAGMLSFLIDGSDVFTGDTLFKGSVGGVRAPGHTTYADLKHSVMDVLLALPAETTIHPGHTDPTTVAEELEHNPFVRIWRGLDREGTGACEALGKPARLVLLARDYDGGNKAWVRWPDGTDDLVPGSRVQTSEPIWDGLP